jgi:hypothetical protein
MTEKAITVDLRIDDKLPILEGVPARFAIPAAQKFLPPL